MVIDKKEKIIEFFTEIKKIWDSLGDIYRSRSYENAIARIKKDSLEGIGERLLAKINEIQKTGLLKEYDELQKYSILLNVMGFGKKGIRELIAKGIKIDSYDDLLVLENKFPLTNLQKIGIKYYNRLMKNIPHEIVATINKKIQDAISQYCEFYLAAGSFRREREISNDLDILIICNDRPEIDQWIFDNAEEILMTGKKRVSFLFATDKEKVIQIDFRFIGINDIGTATLYFTGSKKFNISIRNLAKSKGFKLNEYALIDEEVDMPLLTYNEEDIFELLSIQYIAPKDRQ